MPDPRQDLAAPSVGTIETIVAMKDPAPRNLEITRTYHQLTLALTRLFGDKNVSWCAYATWASNTAGRYIRGDEIPALIRNYLDGAQHIREGTGQLNSQLREVHNKAQVHESAITRTLEDSLQSVSENVGQGNLIVFAELAPPFARMAEAWKNTTRYDQNELDAFLSQFRPGSPETGGESLLKTAWENYYKALFETDPYMKAQYLYMANALCGYQEQIRLQGPIAGALNSPLADTVVDLLHLHATREVPDEKHGIIRSLVEKIARPLAQKIEQEWDDIATRWLMTLQLPDITLDLGKNVPALANGQDFPEDLQTLNYPPLVELMDKLDRHPNSLAGSAAKDWANLSDRMNYVVNFFRSRQQDPTLYESPFMTPA